MPKPGAAKKPVEAEPADCNRKLKRLSSTGISKLSGLDIYNRNITNASTISAQNYSVGSRNIISASAQANFRDLEIKDNNNKVTVLVNGDDGDISCGSIITGNIRTYGEIHGPSSFIIDPAQIGDDTGKVIIKGDLQVNNKIDVMNGLKVDGLNESQTTKLLYYNPSTKEITYDVISFVDGL